MLEKTFHLVNNTNYYYVSKIFEKDLLTVSEEEYVAEYIMFSLV